MQCLLVDQLVDCDLLERKDAIWLRNVLVVR